MDDIKKPLPRKATGTRKPDLDARLRLAGGKPKAHSSVKASASVPKPGYTKKVPTSLDGMTPAVKPQQRLQPVAEPATAPTAVSRPSVTKSLRSFPGNLRRFVPVRSLARVSRLLQDLWQSVPFTRRFQITYAAVLIAALIAIPVGLSIARYFTAQRYVLSTATKQLIGEPAPGLDAKLTYNKQAKAFQFNPDAGKGLSGPSGADGDNGVKIGGSKYYGVNLATAVSKGQTFTDTTTKLSFTIAPAFSALSGKHQDGHVIYPFSKGQVVYTLKDNGLREDVILPKPVNSINLDYKLTLPDTLTARVQPDGSLGVYSADPSLFGNISYGGSSDQQAVEKARTNGQKNNLVFMLPAPVIAASKGATAAAKAHFSLKGSTLSVVADGLHQLHYPISIDPSVVVQSANAFTNGNNEDGNAAITTSSVTRGALTGGTLAGTGWHYTSNGADNGTTYTSGLPASRDGGPLVAYNGYLYVMGGVVGGALSTEVRYAPINSSNGTIGAWSVTQPINTARSDGGAVAYNGYMYLLGGAYSGTSYANDVQYAPINADGSLGAWHYTYNNADNGTTQAGGFSSGRFGEGATIYNGYIYIAGGCASWFINTCNGNQGDVQYAPINANGTVGAWNPTTAFAGGNAGHIGPGMAAYNGYMYLVGGVNQNVSYSFTGSTIYAPINANGTVGAWVTTTSMSVARGLLGVSVSNGYIYAVGGYGTGSTYQAAVEYAPIYANGALGPWAATSNIMTGRKEAMTAVYNGYIYSVGGQSNTSSGGCTTGSGPYDCSDVQYAKIDPPGVLQQSTWLTGTSMSGAASMVAKADIAYGGYIYASGGYDSGGTEHNQVQYAPINTDGSIGTWNPTSSMGTNRVSHRLVAYNGYMYALGGCTAVTIFIGCTGVTNSVEYAPINANGTLGTWNPTSGLIGTQDYGMGATAYNGYMYANGGYGGSTEYAQITATGTLGSWANTTTQAPANTGMIAAYAGYLYTVSGNNGTASTGAVYSSPIGSGGNVTGSWTATTSMLNSGDTAANGGWTEALYTMKGYLYVINGYGGSNSVQFAQLNTNGTVGSWAYTTAAVATGGGQSSITTQGIYIVTDNETTEYQLFNNGGSGNTNSWTPNATSLNTKRTGHGAVVSNGYLYVLGGLNNGTTLTSVEYALVNVDGSIGTFNTTSSMNGSTSGPSSNSGYAAYNGYIYKTGGNNGSTSTGNDVQYAAVCTGKNTTTVFITNCTTSSTPGTLSSWAYTANSANNGTTQSGGLITARSQHIAAVYSGYLYVAGGCTSLNGAFSSCNGFSNTVDSAPLNATNGTVGTWTTAGNFTTGRYGVSGAIYNGYLYVAGGCSSNDGFGNCNALLSDVQYAQLSNGTLTSNAGCGSTWCYGPSFSNPGWWSGNALSANNGYLYLLGVENHNTAAANTQYAPIYANGAFGQWQSASTSYTTNRLGKAMLAYTGNLYVIGGCNANVAACNNSQMGDVQYVGLQVQARAAHYSYLVDLKSTSNGTVGGDPQITRFGVGYTGTSASSMVNACLQGATTAAPSNNNIFGSDTCLTNLASKTPQAWKNYGRYAFAFVTLDDSQSGTFPDVNQTSLTELDTYFHAAPARRLRMGQTFTNMGGAAGTNNQLDTEGP